jgi:23S rRNA (adenine2030-N6)-methyltransferase
LLAGLRTSAARFPTATHVGWYPIKHRTPVRALHDAIRAGGPRDTLAAEFLLRPPTDPGRLNGCGLLVINPPYLFEADIPAILAALVSRLADDPGAAWAVERLSDE